MEERLGQQQGRRQPAAAAAAPAAPAPADDPFTRTLTGILSVSGGVAHDRHLPQLLQLVRRAKSRPHRAALLAVLQLSSPGVLRGAVSGGLLLELQAWLGEFVAEGKQPMVKRTLACLDKLPVTLAALQPPCELGKAVGKLRKHEAFGSQVIEPAKRLVARWRAMVDAAVKSKATAAGGAGARCERCCMYCSVQAALRLCNPPCRGASCSSTLASWAVRKRSAVSSASRAGYAPRLVPTATRPHATTRTLLRSAAPSAAPPAKPAPAKPAAGSSAPAKPAAGSSAPLDRQLSGGASKPMEDGDLFKSTDRQRAGIKDAVPSVKKVRGHGRRVVVMLRRAMLARAFRADRLCTPALRASRVPMHWLPAVQEQERERSALPARVRTACTARTAHLPPPPCHPPRQVVMIKTLPVEATRGAKPADTNQAAGSPRVQATLGGKPAAAQPDVSKVSASPFTSLGGLGSGVTMLGGSGGGGLMGVSLSTVGPGTTSAKDRAAAAARRVPSPEPQPPKGKRKKVAWMEEPALDSVRWFLKVRGRAPTD